MNKNNSQPIPQVFDSTFTDIDSDLDAKTFGNAGCTVIAAFIRSETKDGITINPSSDPSTEPLMVSSFSNEFLYLIYLLSENYILQM